MAFSWGLLGAGVVTSERRVRTLGVAASIRRFNELAVPGIGGLWFGKQVMLATLGVKVAELASRGNRVLTNIETANAIEALACWLDFDERGWRAIPRLRGVNKMRHQTDLAFRFFRQQKFYVSQPMRMSTVEALPALGLVEATGARFNTFRCSLAGDGFIEAACEPYRPFNRTVLAHLVKWAQSNGGDDVRTQPLRDALAPTLPLTERARVLLRERLNSLSPIETEPMRNRRRDALAWVDAVRTQVAGPLNWNHRPAQIQEAAHWEDLRAGAFFTAARDAALNVLDSLEVQLRASTMPLRLRSGTVVAHGCGLSLATLRDAAQRYLDEARSDAEANAFCRECVARDDLVLLRSLVERDGRVLRLRNDEVTLNPAFAQHATRAANSATVDANDEDSAPSTSIVWPPAISVRIRNLFLLNADLYGDLDRWIARPQTEVLTDAALEEAV
jgi:hypothetical protein